MAMTWRLPEADGEPFAEPAVREGPCQHESVVNTVHRFLAERGEFFDRTLNQGIADNAELLDRLAR